ncbi:hypothetical protein LB515_11830 [Mesorhizobium sp. CA15]|uniref:hypothetical protein n=1 Tax=Mesorhizobium sp. CA15 TaxID=2876641 RepID=UPI001CD11D34|nr:hypothetical protein [Mesorhizobium sp. CA15]MBZ9866069.1 hypothetical protein [Mesorhizobium sp. CA15]
MTARKDRLKKLVKVQEQLKALHETRHAGFLAAAVKAEAEAKELIERFDTDSSLAGLFPALYHRRITDALGRQQQNLDNARQEAALIATATARTNMVERAYKEVRRRDERERSDRERLDLIMQKRASDG